MRSSMLPNTGNIARKSARSHWPQRSSLAARYGIAVRDAQDVIETAIGGKNLTFTIEGRQRFPVRVRYARDFREDIEELRNVLVAGSNGTQIPLAQIASIRIVMGPSMITSENGLLRGTVLMNVRGRDVGGF